MDLQEKQIPPEGGKYFPINQGGRTKSLLINRGAGFWIRFLARLIDVVFSVFLGFFSGLVFGFFLVLISLIRGADPMWIKEVADKLSGQSISTDILSIIGLFSYYVICEGVSGATLGKLICGLRVLGEDGKPCPPKAAFLRNIGYFLDAIFFGVVGYISMRETPLNQRYGDKWAKTVVVKKSQVPPSLVPSTGKFILGFLIGSFFWGALLILGLALNLAELSF